MATALLLVSFRRNPWLWALLPIALWHAAEHVAIINYYLHTGIEGSPGLWAHGGAINGGLPLIRPDLHFIYNLIEETLILVGFWYQSKQMSRNAKRSIAAVPVLAPVAEAIAVQE